MGHGMLFRASDELDARGGKSTLCKSLAMDMNIEARMFVPVLCRWTTIPSLKHLYIQINNICEIEKLVHIAQDKFDS